MSAPTTRGGGRVRMAVADRRAQIIASATRLVAQRGFWNVTIRDVAIDCDITEAGLLHHVGSKDGMLVAILEHRDGVDMDSLARRLGLDPAELDADASPVGLSELCRALVERNATQPEIVRLYAVLEGESLNETHPAYDYFRAREEWALGLFTRAAMTDGETRTQAAASARRALAAMDGLQLRWLRAQDSFDLVAEWDALFALLRSA